MAKVKSSIYNNPTVPLDLSKDDIGDSYIELLDQNELSALLWVVVVR
jgi:hypothetical protein